MSAAALSQSCHWALQLLLSLATLHVLSTWSQMDFSIAQQHRVCHKRLPHALDVPDGQTIAFRITCNNERNQNIRFRSH